MQIRLLYVILSEAKNLKGSGRRRFVAAGKAASFAGLQAELYILFLFWADYGKTEKETRSMEPNWLKGPMPFDLGMALLENPPALEKYAALGRAEKQLFIDNASTISGRTQMQAYVQAFIHELQ